LKAFRDNFISHENIFVAILSDSLTGSQQQNIEKIAQAILKVKDFILLYRPLIDLLFLQTVYFKEKTKPLQLK
jgi:hypothetical protein